MKQMLGVVLAVSAIVTAGLAFPQANYPEKPIRIIVGFPAGSSPDITARHLGQKLAESWAKSVVVDNVPGAAGTNNHEGSSLTENREAMTFLMSELKTRGLFFLDSMTSPKSSAYTVAKEFGLKAARRDVFLDNDGGNPAAIRKQFDELARTAKQNGRAIGIAHPHPATIVELRKWLAETDVLGVEVVPVSRLMQ